MRTDLPPITLALLLANIAGFAAQYLIGPSILAHFALWPLGVSGADLIGGDLVTIAFAPWQLLTYGFLHGSPEHLMFNMLALYMFGSRLSACGAVVRT